MAAIPPKKQSKYNNKILVINGVTYHSQKEYQRECVLKNQERAGIIKDLERQVTYSLDVNCVHICDYIADWRYIIVEGNIPVVEDFKGVITDIFRLKSNLMKACHGITVWANKKVNAHCANEYPR